MKNFKKEKDTFIKEINCKFIEYTHIGGAKIINIANDDKENLFSISLKTFPFNSCGIFHILEHIVLCGSKKFPTKDPFFEMRKRSLHTFMNAMTGDDFTCYPASSEIEKDFYNLLEVYLDAVFFPLLTKESFYQEGWRLEKKAKKYEVKGVVFNEMKGALSSADERLFLIMFEKLMPSLPYSYNAGGDPKKIVSLNHTDLIKAHKKFYHPSNAIFFFYGNLKIEKHLKFLEKNLLKNFTKKLPALSFNQQKRFIKEKEYTSYFPSIKKEDDIISFGWLTTNIANRQDILALKILESILLETDASPLKYALLNSKLCKHVESFIDINIKEIPWMITLKGTNKKHKNKIFNLIKNTLQNIKITKKEILSAMHKLQFENEEIKSSPMPYGLFLFMRTVLLKQHGIKNCENFLKTKTIFKNLQKTIEKNPKYLYQILEKYILKNKHLVKLTLCPNANLEEKEKKEFLKVKNTLIKEKKFYKKTKEIDFKSPNILPKLKIKEIPKNPKYYKLQQKKDSLFLHKCFTNEILYVDLVFDLAKIEKEELFYLSFLTSILEEVDCGKRNYIENLNYIHSYIGKIYGYISLNEQVKYPNKLRPTIAIKAACLYKNQKKLFSLLKEITTSLRFTNKKRIKELLLQHFTIFSHQIVENALSFAKLESLENFSTSSFIQNQLNGLSYFQNLKKHVEKENNFFIEKLESIYKKVFTSKPQLIITADKKFLEKHNFENFLKHFKNTAIKKWEDFPLEKEITNTGKIIPSPVFFNALGTKTINLLHKNSAYLYLASKIFENKILHPQIREKGGAYGSGSIYNAENGNLYFFSYRDPNLHKTINIFLQSIKEIQKGLFNIKEIESAKLRVIQKIDRLVPVGQRGSFTFYQEKSGKNLQLIKDFREKVLLASKKDIINGANELSSNLKDYKISSFGGKEILEVENKKLKKPLKIKSI